MLFGYQPLGLIPFGVATIRYLSGNPWVEVCPNVSEWAELQVNYVQTQECDDAD